jgi:hypothetical protein
MANALRGQGIRRATTMRRAGRRTVRRPGRAPRRLRLPLAPRRAAASTPYTGPAYGCSTAPFLAPRVVPPPPPPRCPLGAAVAAAAAPPPGIGPPAPPRRSGRSSSSQGRCAGTPPRQAGPPWCGSTPPGRAARSARRAYTGGAKGGAGVGKPERADERQALA